MSSIIFFLIMWQCEVHQRCYQTYKHEAVNVKEQLHDKKKKSPFLACDGNKVYSQHLSLKLSLDLSSQQTNLRSYLQ